MESPAVSHPHVFFHIGLHKTGTTWLQRALFPALPDVITKRSRSFPNIKDLVANDDAVLVISHEGMSGSISPQKSPGDRDKRLRENIEKMSALNNCNGIIIGFREQLSWINSAYSEKAKKEPVLPDSYLESFTSTELSWCRLLDTVGAARVPIFCFLYEELLHGPEALVSDLCGFLGTPVPSNWSEISERRENRSPRGGLGQHASRALFSIARVLKRAPLISRAKRPLRSLGSKLGTRLDRYSAPATAITFNDALARELKADWKSLLNIVGERRGRDFSALALSPARSAPV
jgi:hypothetical protein